MALYATGSGRYAEVYQAYWNQLVPESGRCNTVQGELIRVIGRLAIEYYRNGNMNWEDGYDLMLVWMSRTLHDQTVFEPDQLVQIQRDVASIRANAESGCCPYTDGEDEYDRLTDRIVEWCRRRSDPLTLTDELPYDHRPLLVATETSVHRRGATIPGCMTIKSTPAAVVRFSYIAKSLAAAW